MKSTSIFFLLLIITMFATVVTTRNITAQSEDNPLLFSAYFGGLSHDSSYDLLVDYEDNIIVIGSTRSSSFPTQNSYDDTYNGNNDGFISKFDQNGVLIWSTFFGGSQDDFAKAGAIDMDNNIAITGITYSTDFPIMDAYNSTPGLGSNAFLAKLSADGDLIWSSYLGGSSSESGNGISFDRNNDVVLIGTTESFNFPILNGINDTLVGSQDAFVSKFSSEGILMWSSYVSGSFEEYGSDIIVDSENNYILTGDTWGMNFFGSNDTVFDVFVLKLSVDGEFIWNSLIGGSSDEYHSNIDVDKNDNIFVVGETFSTDFPTSNSFNDTFGGEVDFFVTKLDPHGGLLWGTYVGSQARDTNPNLAINNKGDLTLTGNVISQDYPTKNAYFDDYHISSSNCQGDAVITKFSNLGELIWSTYFGGSCNDFGNAIDIDSKDNIWITGVTDSHDFPTFSSDSSYQGSEGDLFISKINGGNYHGSQTHSSRLKVYFQLGIILKSILAILVLRTIQQNHILS